MTPFAPSVHAARRAALASKLRAGGARGLVLLPGHGHSPMNYRDNAYPFRQDSSFLYFCGLDWPGLALLIDLDDDSATLYGHEADLDDLVWTGPVPSLAERAAAAGLARQDLAGALPTALAQACRAGRPVHYLPPYRSRTRLDLAAWLGLADSAVEPGASPALVRAVVALRAVKEPAEIAEIEEALALTRELHLAAMRLTRPGVVEQEVVGAMEGLALTQGRRLAYPSIFTSRGEILHNHDHSVRLAGGEMVVNDTGAESARGYASDITRTLPVGRRFEGLQADFYDLVLLAQRRAIEAARPGVPYLQVHERACTTMVEGMIAAGFMRGDPAEAVREGAHAIFFQCGTGHMMGLDVHDMEALGEQEVGYGPEFRRSALFGHRSLRLARPLEPGFVVTVEPGIYINPWLTQRWRAEGRHAAFVDYDRFERQGRFGGIRIEDDVLVTAEGPRVLGPALPKERGEVEALCGAGGAA